MTRLTEHPTVKAVSGNQNGKRQQVVDAEWLRQLCLEAGADDVGFVKIGQPELGAESDEVLKVFPQTRSLISIVCKMNREPIRSTARSIANLEFHHVGDDVNTVTRTLVARLQEAGIRAINPAMGFPMEMDVFPGRIWSVSHKLIAVAAGLGQMGIHRNVIHPRFGSFILLGTVLLEAEIDDYTTPIDFNPCLECKLCVAACPTGAIGADGHFDFSACITHNYREFMGGFSDWVETVAESDSRQDYRDKVTLSETVSWWQSLSFGANYKAAYCVAVCPAGEDVITPFLDDRKQFLEEVVDPLQTKEEVVFVTPKSDAEQHVARRFPRKTTKRVNSRLTPSSIDGFLAGLRLTFQRQQSKGLAAVYHFEFHGSEGREATIEIRDGRLRVEDGLRGKPDLTVRAEAQAWLDFLSGRRHIAVQLLLRRIRLHGSLKLLLAFGRCFPV